MLFICVSLQGEENRRSLEGFLLLLRGSADYSRVVQVGMWNEVVIPPHSGEDKVLVNTETKQTEAKMMENRYFIKSNSVSPELTGCMKVEVH